MSQADSLLHIGVANAGTESSYGVAATTDRIPIDEGSLKPNLVQAEVENADESPEFYDARTTVLGLQSGSGVEFMSNLQLLAAVASSGTLTVTKFHDLMRTIFGGMSPASGASLGGTTHGTPGTAVAVDLVSAANFAVGQGVLVPTANGNEFGVIRTIVSNTLNLNPGLSAVPSAGAAVAHALGFYPTPTNALSSTLEYAVANDANEQYRLLGCTGGLQLTIAQNELLKLAFSLKAASFQQGALSLTTTVATTGTGGPIAKGDGAVFLLQAAATAAPTHYPVEEIALDMDFSMIHKPDLGGTKQGTSGVMRGRSRRHFAEITATFVADNARRAEWTNRTALQCGFQVPQGSGLTRQWAGFHAPLVRMVGNPVVGASSEGRTRYTVKLRTQIDTSLTGILKAPLYFFVS